FSPFLPAPSETDCLSKPLERLSNLQFSTPCCCFAFPFCFTLSSCLIVLVPLVLPTLLFGGSWRCFFECPLSGCFLEWPPSVFTSRGCFISLGLLSFSFLESFSFALSTVDFPPCLFLSEVGLFHPSP